MPPITIFQLTVPITLSLSTLVLNSRDRPKNIWFPNRMHLDKQLYKNQNTKNQPQRYNYSSNNAISSFKQAKCCKICPLENFEWNHIFVCQPASQPACLPANRNWPRAYTAMYIAFKFSEINIISVGTNLCYSYRNTRCVPSSVLCSFILTDWFLAWNKGV